MVQSGRFLRWLFLAVAGLLMLARPLAVNLPGKSDTVQAASCWKAEITEQWVDLDVVGSVLRVSVHGKMGLPVTVRSIGDFTTIGYTSTKPEVGPFAVEFAPLSKGKYFIEPQGLDTVFEIWLDGRNISRVDFTPLPCAPTPTQTPRPTVVATARPQPTATRAVAAVVAPTAQPPAKPVQTISQWRGRIAQDLRGLDGRHFATVAVRVIGRPAGQQVSIESGGWSAACTTGTKPEHGPDACEFGALQAGTYRLSPKGLDTFLDVTVELQDFVQVEFYYAGPPANTRWVASVVENTSGSESTEYVNSAITVVVAGRPWHEVEIQADGWSTTAQTGFKPEYGPDACEFGGLRASTYTIIPKGLGVSAQVTVDGWGWAKVQFSEVAVPVPQPAEPQPRSTVPVKEIVIPTTVPTNAPTAASPTPMPPTPTPKDTGWKGWVLSNTSGEQEGTGIWSVVIVRVFDRPRVSVTITGGGGWNATCVTGTKPEYGPDACEFGGLWPGIYYIRPEGADVPLDVMLDGLGTAVVAFAAP